MAGFDATFSAPKSLSVWWALTGDPGLLDAHDVAVTAALEHLERYRGDHPDPASGAAAASRHARVDDGHVPPDHVPGRRPAAPHPRRDLGQGPDRRRAVAGVGCPVPEAAPADAGRPVPVGAASRAHPPLRDHLGTGRQRAGRDRRHPGRAVGGVLEADRPGRRRTGRQGRASSGPGRAGTRPAGSGPPWTREAAADTRATQDRPARRRPAGAVAGRSPGVGLDRRAAHRRSHRPSTPALGTGPR